jgi:hypothetical protein
MSKVPHAKMGFSQQLKGVAYFGAKLPASTLIARSR